MTDPRVYRQTVQSLLSCAMVLVPIAVTVPFDWRALLMAGLGWLLSQVTNPRLVVGFKEVMPEKGSSAVIPRP